MSHEHIVNDSDKHFSIDPVTREIVNESGKIVLVQGDHKSEQFTFTIPRHVDGHDMSQCNMVQVHYTNIEKATSVSGAMNEDVYETGDLRVDPDNEDAVIFSWLITGNATQYVGLLSFSISYNCVAENGDIEYSWNTVEYEEISIKSRRNNSESVITTYPDVLAKWRAETFQMVQDQIDETVDGTAYVHRSGDTMTGSLSVPDPTEAAHATNKEYVDSKRMTATAALSAAWSGDSAPYTQTVSVPGILESDRPHISPAYSDSLETKLAQKEAWAMVSDAEAVAGAIIFTCFEEMPAVEIPIQIEVIR